MVYKKIEYREFNSLEEIVRWEELNLDKKYKAIRGDLIYSHDPTAQAILQYSGFLYRPLNYYGRISSNAIIRCGNKKYIKYITDLVEFMYDFPIPENIVTYRFIHRKDFSQLRIAARQEYGLVKCWTSLLEKGFTSTTLLPSKYLESYDCTYNTENSVCIKILVPKGSFGIFVSPIAGRIHESELLLAPYATLKPRKCRKNEILCDLSAQDHISVIYDCSVKSYFSHMFPCAANLDEIT